MRGKASSFARYYFPLVILCSAFCADSFARSREHTRSEGEIKERRQLLQLITDLAAIVFWLVSSKSSGAPLGKMRGLITVKLANEQVNYGAKFLYKKCHFSKRRSSTRTESLKQAVGEDRVEQEEKQRTNRSFSISVSRKVSGFRNSELRSTPFELERKRLRQWAFFFSEETFFLFLFLWLKRLHQPPPPLQLFTQFPRSQAFIFTPQWSLWDAWDFFFLFFFLCFSTSMYKKKFLSHRLKFARTFAHVKIKLLSLLTGEKMEHLG